MISRILILGLIINFIDTNLNSIIIVCQTFFIILPFICSYEIDEKDYEFNCNNLNLNKNYNIENINNFINKVRNKRF